MTRYKEIRLVFNKNSKKNKDLKLMINEENEYAGTEFYEKQEDNSLESTFITRLVEAHDLYISSNI